ncbi:UDP-glucose/GDP-mannose dehydrogenase family protein [Crassaminicella indica]|uniref:UDP-glucose 6-dehydrogenase n=1 Tax=Crassaminicella indica TaxID=2855394 RepID=A0ABX8RI67_9CLOT|nr:UDP-glucose/GDP-mannose dehydrogenase family protein [Crassaminicella indica]
MLKIGVVGGLGHIGLIQAVCLAKIGYKTIAYDIDKMKIEGILKGKMPFYEEGLAELIMETINKNLLKFTSNIKDLKRADIIFICVGTPSFPNGEADLSQVYSAVEQVAENRDSHCIVVIKSTVSVGTCRKLTDNLKNKGLSERITIVSNPEFLKEGSGIKDFWNPTRIIVGSEIEQIGKEVSKLYQPQGVPVLLTSWENAEMIKLVSNAFLATKISFINEISFLSEKAGADIRIISKGIGLDPRINPHFLEAGVGFSGPCLEKDLKSLIYQFQKKQEKASILESVLQVNERQRQRIIEKLEEQLGTLKGKKIGVLGMAFKENTDDVRRSHSLEIVKNIIAQGGIVTVTDPCVKKPEDGGISKEELSNVEWVESPLEAAKGKDAILILTAWEEYKKLDIDKVKEAMINPLIIDGRNLFEVEDMKAKNIHYIGVGI